MLIVQRHIHKFGQWCKDNMLEVNASKSRAMIFGTLFVPLASMPQFTLHDDLIPFTSTHKYVGVHFQSTHANIFREHYEAKAEAAEVSALATLFGTDSVVGRGTVPPKVALQLYNALVDCHLIHGCEVMPDVDNVGVALLEDVPFNIVDVLFTETGMLPIRVRQTVLTLRYLKYLLTLPTSQYAARALRVSDTLRLHKKASWLGDLDHVLRELLPGFVKLPAVGALDATYLDGLISTLKASTKSALMARTEDMVRLYLLRGRREPLEGGSKRVACILHHYLEDVSIPEHRTALTKTLLGGHLLRGIHGEHRAPSPLHMCRHCQRVPETPEHMLLEYDALDGCVADRARFWATVDDGTTRRWPMA